MDVAEVTAFDEQRAGPGSGALMPTAEPLWFGPDERPLFGWVHQPTEGEARAGVLLCPSLAREAICGYTSYRLLAESLSARGFLVVRFDYDATGDSAGELVSHGQVDAWRGSIASAVGLVRAHGIDEVVMVGSRIGCLLLAQTARTKGISAAVLWDPPANGKRYLRRQTALTSLALRGSEAGAEVGLEIPGLLLPSDAAAAIQNLSFTDLTGTPVPEVLVLSASGRPDPTLEGAGFSAKLTWKAQGDISSALDGNLPVTGAVGTTSDWIDEVVSRHRSPVKVPVGRRSAVVEVVRDLELEESARFFGEIGLFAIQTVARGGTPTPLVIFVNVSMEPHVGPARAWVDCSRQLAQHGIRCVRFDLSGLGDSPVREGQERTVVYAAEAYDDLRVLVEELGAGRTDHIMLVGLCSGAYVAIEVGSQLGVGSVMAINPALVVPTELLAATEVPWQSKGGRMKVMHRLLRFGLVGRVHDALPAMVWRLLDRTGIRRCNANLLQGLLDHEVETFVVFGDNDLRPIWRKIGWRLRSLEKDPRFHLDILPVLDHSLLDYEGRVQTKDLILQRAREWSLLTYPPG
jgi:pimeloyl-ACP methyl ester carboxylesterase